MVGAVNHSSTQQFLSVPGVSNARRLLHVISLARDGCAVIIVRNMLGPNCNHQSVYGSLQLLR